MPVFRKFLHFSLVSKDLEALTQEMVNVPDKLETVLRDFNGVQNDLIHSSYLSLKLILVLLKVSYSVALQLLMSRFFNLSVLFEVLVKPFLDCLIGLSSTSLLNKFIVHLGDTKVIWAIFSENRCRCGLVLV